MGNLLYREKDSKRNTNLGRGMSYGNHLVVVNQNRASVRIIEHDRLVAGAISSCKTFCVRFTVESSLVCCALSLANDSVRDCTIDGRFLNRCLLGLLWDLDISSKSDCFAITCFRAEIL